MKKFSKVCLLIFLLICMVFSTGCWKNTKNTFQSNVKDASICSKKDNKEDDKKKIKKENSECIKEESKNNKEASTNFQNKEKINEEKGSKEKNNDNKNHIKESNTNKGHNDALSKENHKISNSTKVSQKKTNENTSKDLVKSQNVKETSKEIKTNTFTLIIGKNLKGYTGQKEEVFVKKNVKIQDKKNAMTYLRENSQIQEKGGFIYEINGIHNLYPIPASEKTEEQKKLGIMGKDWFIYLNGKKTPVGANEVYPKTGDVLLLDFHEWDKREFSPSAY